MLNMCLITLRQWIVLLVCPAFAVLYSYWALRAYFNHKAITFDSVVLFTNSLIVNYLSDFSIDDVNGDRLVHILPFHVFNSRFLRAHRHFPFYFLQVRLHSSHALGKRTPY